MRASGNDKIDRSHQLQWYVLRGAGITVFAALATWASFSLLHSIEARWGLSALYSIRGARATPPQVSVIGLSLRAAEELGVPARAYRWPRSLHAELIDGLHAAGATVVAFDLLFDRARGIDGDKLLTQALRRSGKVVLVQYLRRDKVPTGNGVAVIDRIINPLPQLTEAALASAPFVLLKTPGGAIDYLAFAPEGSDVPSLPLVLAAAMDPGPLKSLSAAMGLSSAGSSLHRQIESLRGVARANPQRFTTALELVRMPSKRHWLSMLSARDSRITLNLYGPPGHIDTVPYYKAIEWLRTAAPKAARLQNRAVLVGLSEFNQPEQRDAFRTPWSSPDGLDYSGTELAATALANQLDGSALKRLPALQEMGLLGALSALFLAPWIFLQPRGATIASAMLALGYGIAACASFALANQWLPFAVPLFAVLPAAIIVGLIVRYRDVEGQRKRLSMVLDRYAPDDVITELAREMHGRNDSINVVCMSSDIEDYTRRVEQRDPADARRWINAYFEKIFPIIRAHGGHVVDHAGDSMVCIWFSSSDAQAACRAAVRAARAIHIPCNTTQRDQSGGFDLDAWPTRIGLHLGPVALGNVGDTLHAEPRVVGDIVNTASRIQAANKVLGTRVLVSELVAAHLPVQSTRVLGQFMLQGKAQPIGLADPMPVTSELGALYTGALAAHQQGQWNNSRHQLTRLLERFPNDGPAKYLLTQLHEPAPFRLPLK